MKMTRMTTSTLRPAPVSERRFVLEGVSWAYYEQTLAELGEQHVRITYDRGRMEFMSPSPRHERVKKIIGRLVELYALEADIPILPLGSVTCRREDLARGLEPDECYYVQNSLVDPDKMDLSVDPPPDLAIEVDITSGSIPRQPIYAALGVPEIWRFDGREIYPMLRQTSGTYRRSDSSLVFPQLPMAQLNHFLNLALTEDQHAAMKGFQDSARQQPR